jgi:hypothetical protein
MPDFNNDPSFRGEGRGNPPPRPRAERGKDSLSHLNFTRGTRIRVLKDNGKTGLVGLVGVVVQAHPGSVVVELDNDPMLFFRTQMVSGFADPGKSPLRHFHASEVERV